MDCQDCSLGEKRGFVEGSQGRPPAGGQNGREETAR